MCYNIFTYILNLKLERCCHVLGMSPEYLGGTIQLSPMAARLRLLSLAVNARLLSSITVIPRLTWRMCSLLIHLRPLLLNEPFAVTVETSVRITVELLLLAMQRSIVAFPWESLLDSKHVTLCLIY
jgi:hypothetical protein